jgi:hypothetical protein
MSSPVSRPAPGLVGRAAFAAACFATVLAPVHALARFATVDGAEDLESPAVRFWAEPAARSLHRLLDWSDPQTVYVAYGRLWLPVLAALTVCAVAVRRHRPAVHGLERWGWRIALPAYGLMTVSVFGDYWTPWMDQAFLVSIAGILLGVVGSALLGIALLRRGFRPRATGWLLVTWFPAIVVLSDLIALGAALVPLVWAWGLAGRAGRADAATEVEPLAEATA